MSGWITHQGQAVCLLRDNIDTDQIIPARFMSQPRSDGYADFLLHDIRKDENGKPDADFVLDRYPNASILVTGRNFGSGSSREAAVYALVDSGIRVVIATGFADIFAANAINNGLLPARVDESTMAIITARINNETEDCVISLEDESIRIEDHTLPFHIDQGWRTKLMNGWDDIDLTLQHQVSISQYRQSLNQHERLWRLITKSSNNQ